MSLGWTWTSRLQLSPEGAAGALRGPRKRPSFMPIPSSGTHRHGGRRTLRVHPLDRLLAGVALDDRQQLTLHRGPSGHDVAAAEGALAAVEIGDDPSGLAHQQH